jgi:hypothetical protein
MDEPRPPRTPYEPPSISRVRLVKTELAAVSCKTTTSMMGPTGSGCFKAMCLDMAS